MAEIEFIKGLFVKKPNEKAPQFVKAKMSFKREELIEWLQAQTGEWINMDIKESQKGEYYVQIDTWKPDGKKETTHPTLGTDGKVQNNEPAIEYPYDEITPEDIPF
jgi:hypothetical protein